MPVNGIYSDSTRPDNIHILNLPAERAKAEAAYTRRIIRRSDFTRAERDILIALTNLWFHHRNGRKGFIHPGRNMLAKKAKASIRTVASALALFRDLDFLTAQRYASGGTGCATQYTVSIRAIWDFIDPDNVQMMPGELEKIHRQTVQQTGSFDDENCTVSACNNCTLSYLTYEPTLNENPAFKSVQPSIAEAGE
jgi:hypothetical protein